MQENTSPIYTEFLPISRADMEARGWDQLDFVVVGGDAYVDHPSFGTAIISRLLEAEGYKVGVLAQPRYSDCEDFKRFGRPKYGFFIGGGNVDSMVSHYSVAKIPRAEDEYSPGGIGGARPDRSATVYTRLAKEAYPDLPVILGGLEASLRRFAHYDYWLDTVLPSIAEDSGADLISFGMGEHQTVEIARRLAAGEPVESITDVDGTCYLTDFDHLPEKYVECAGFRKVASDKVAYAKACRIQMDNQDVVSGQIIVQKQSEKYLVQNIPAKPLVRWELDKVYALPYTRRYHPIYESMGGVPAIREVQFSIIQNRGCFGGFGFRNDSFASMSPYVQWVVTIFMILFGVNFNAYFLLLMRRFRRAAASEEVRAYFVIIGVAVVIITANIYSMYNGLGEALRHAAFQVGSIITTTGFSSCDFDLWPTLSKEILVMLMFVGACAGSTGGGMKVSRLLLMGKTVGKELKQALHPQVVAPVRMDGKVVNHETIRATNVYVAAYIFIFAASFFLISLDGFDMVTNFTAIAATLNNIGPGLAQVGPMMNFGSYSNPAKLVMIFDMLAGRLEIFPMLVFFMPDTWRRF